MKPQHKLLLLGLRAAGVLAALESTLWLMARTGKRCHEELQARMAAGESTCDRHHPTHSHHAA